MWDAGFMYGVGGTRFGVNLPGIHPFEVITTVADANACPKNCDFSSRATNDCNPNLSGRAFLYQSCDIHLAVAVKISLQIRRIHVKREVILSSDRPVR